MGLDPYLLGIGASIIVLLFVFDLLRRGVLREKFAALWLVVAAALVIMAVFPRSSCRRPSSWASKCPPTCCSS